MILITGITQTIDVTLLSPFERSMYHQLRLSPALYSYSSTRQLRFELALRARIVHEGRALNSSGVSFATFKNSRCNEQFWNLTREGGFRLKRSVSPASAIRDIFVNGQKYAFECATAMVIVLYKAVLELLNDNQFNRLFANLYLWDWHYDKDLRLIEKKGSRYALPGDVLYFKNPDVSPETPQWQGENAIKLDGDSYYGHGIGITSAAGIIDRLNRARKPGSTQSAYLTDDVIYPDFMYLSQFTPGGTRLARSELIANFVQSEQMYVQVGGRHYIRRFT